MSTPYLPEGTGREPTAAELATSRDPRVGVAYAVSLRNEGGGENTLSTVVLTYRLRRLDPSGRELPVLQVEMRGRHLLGTIADGDVVQAAGPLPPSGTLQLETVTNLTTGAPVALQRQRVSTLGLVLAVLFIAFAVVVLLLIIAGFVTMAVNT